MQTPSAPPLSSANPHTGLLDRASRHSRSNKITTLARAGIALWLGACVCACEGLAADSSQWGGTAAKNMVSMETHLPETFVPGEGANGQIDLATTKNVKWVARTGAFSCATPTIAGGKVFIGGMIDRQGVLKCFDEATGKLLWQWTQRCRTDLKADAMNFRSFPKMLGVCSTPAVDGDRVYFVDQNCVVNCLDVNGQAPAAGGGVGEAKALWSFDMFADPAVGARPSDACNGSPLIDGPFLYVTTSNGVDRIISVPIAEDAARRCMAPKAPTLIVLDASGSMSERIKGETKMDIAKRAIRELVASLPDDARDAVIPMLSHEGNAIRRIS